MNFCPHKTESDLFMPYLTALHLRRLQARSHVPTENLLWWLSTCVPPRFSHTGLVGFEFTCFSACSSVANQT